MANRSLYQSKIGEWFLNAAFKVSLQGGQIST